MGDATTKQVEADSVTSLMSTPSPCRPNSDIPCITIDGVRLALLTGPIETSRPAVLLDLGGPGSDPIVAEVELAGLISEAFAGKNVLLPIEPWVYRTPKKACLSSLDRMMTVLRTHEKIAQMSGPGNDVRNQCRDELAAEARFATTGLSVAAKSLSEIGVNDISVVAWSFGAQRALMNGAANVDRYLVVSPFVVDRPIAELMVARADRVREVLGLDRRELKRLYASVRRSLPKAMIDRSVLFTRHDLDAAVLSASYDADSGRDWLVEGLVELSHKRGAGSNPVALRAIAKGADYYLGRYGENSYYPGMIGYFGGMCAAGQMDGSSEETGEAPEEFLLSLHLVCDGLARSNKQPGKIEQNACIVAGQRDPISNLGSARRYLPKAGVVRSTSVGHSTFSGGPEFFATARRFLAGELRECRS